MKRFWRHWPLIILVFIVLMFIAFIVINKPLPEHHEVCESYDECLDQVQNGVTAYMLEHDSQLPPTEGQATAINISHDQNELVTNAEVLDICSVFAIFPNKLKSVHYITMGSAGLSGTNFYTGSCNRPTNDNGHYVFFVDLEGNLYTGCDCNENGRIEEDGMENVSAFSGNCSSNSNAGPDVWP